MDGKHDFSQNEEKNEQDDEYSFLDETVKKRPFPVGKLFMRILVIVSSAALFGLVAGLVFVRVSRRPESTAGGGNVDSDYLAAVNDGDGREHVLTQASSSVSSAVKTASAAEKSENVSPSPSAAAEEVSGTNLSDDTKNAVRTAEKSVVQVTGITNIEDWFSNTDSASSTVSGLIVAERSDSILVLAEYSRLGAPERIIITFPDGTMTDGSLLKEDPTSGLAVLAVESGSVGADTRSSISTAKLGNSYTVNTGDLAIAIGSPMGYSNAVACGHVTSTAAAVSVTDGEFGLIATDLDGSSQGSGILVDTDGNVIAFIIPKYAVSGTSAVAGVGISYLKGIISTLSENGRLSYLGIEGETVTRQLSERLGVPEGVYVNSVDADSPALTAGIAAGDVITEVDGTAIDSVQMLHSRIVNYSPGNEAVIKVMRGTGGEYREFEFRAVIGEKS